MRLHASSLADRVDEPCFWQGRKKFQGSGPFFMGKDKPWEFIRNGVDNYPAVIQWNFSAASSDDVLARIVTNFPEEGRQTERKIVSKVSI
ncbi:hypothetical protein OIU78_013366 [Salix suchowensis]|nr:hypothetical protein OIU78_013366 [Salix suchowensis]